MRILYICQYFWPEPNPYDDTIFYLSKKHDIQVVTAFPNFPLGKIFSGYRNCFFKKECLKHIVIYRFYTYIYKGYNKYKRLLNYIVFTIIASFISPFVVKKFDVIFSVQGSPIFYLIPCLINKYLFKKKLVVWVQDLWPETLDSVGIVNKNDLLYKVLDIMCNIIYQKCDHIYVESPGFLKILKQKGVSASKVEYLPNWSLIDFDSYTDLEEHDRFVCIDSTKFNVMYAGNIGKYQGLEKLLLALNMIKHEKIHCYIVGSGPERNRLICLSKELNLNNVSFLGRIDSKQIKLLYRKIDTLFLQLRKDHLFKHTIPSKLQAYMASGKPIIGAVEGSSADIINEAECGIVVEPENVNEIKNAILRIKALSNMKLKEIGSNGLNYSNLHFNKVILIERINKKLVEIS